jgi:hypothetical protein
MPRNPVSSDPARSACPVNRSAWLSKFLTRSSKLICFRNFCDVVGLYQDLGDVLFMPMQGSCARSESSRDNTQRRSGEEHLVCSGNRAPDKLSDAQHGFVREIPKPMGVGSDVVIPGSPASSCSIGFHPARRTPGAGKKKEAGVDLLDLPQRSHDIGFIMLQAEGVKVHIVRNIVIAIDTARVVAGPMRQLPRFRFSPSGE